MRDQLTTAGESVGAILIVGGAFGLSVAFGVMVLGGLIAGVSVWAAR